MRQDEFTYEATYELFMIGNNTPRFEGGVDEAMRRRTPIIPFIVKILYESLTTSSPTSSRRSGRASFSG